MTESKLMSSSEAQTFARERGCFCRVTMGGFGLAFYTGDELRPGTWMEIGRTGMAGDDKASVSRNAVVLICR